MQYIELIPDWALFLLIQVFIIAGTVWLVACALNAVVDLYHNIKGDRQDETSS